MRVLDPSYVITASGVQSTTAANENVGYALDLSFPLLESILETGLIEGAFVDHYDVVPDAVVNGCICLRTTNRFLQQGSVVVMATTDGSVITSSNPGVAVAEEWYVVDYDLGIVRLLPSAPVYNGLLAVTVSYTSGFATNPVDPTVLEFDGLPEWLKSAAVTAAVQIINTYPSVPSNRKGNNASSVSTVLRSRLMAVLSAHVRPHYGVEFPRMHVTAP